ncbi:MAG: ribosome small subunit-dependent GTPase A [Myxococcales bacterium]|nr:ribosome small subunit-dependent GTPase A [Myxococcales bacterium]
MKTATSSPQYLSSLGIKPEQLEVFNRLADTDLALFRVALEAQAHMALHSPDTRAWGELSGTLLAEQRHNPLARPTVGDFVAARPTEEGSPWRIEHVLPRRTQFVRQSTRRKAFPQLVAANVDLVFVVTTPNNDFSERRLERYITSIHASGAQPAVVINKISLAQDPESWRARAQEVALDAPVILTEALDPITLSTMRDWLEPGRTIALVGSSGVGKSTLTNALLGHERQLTQPIRSSDSKGRHTTTHRELFTLPSHQNGTPQGFLMDTPGMRALALYVEPGSLLEAFAEINKLAFSCRFRNCQHQAEPGCEVRTAVSQGSLSPGRLASFIRLRSEAEEKSALVSTRPSRSSRRRPSYSRNPLG